jgi:hypothetical protein
MRPSKYILDPPSEFGPLERLIEWKEELLTLDQDDPGVQEELADVNGVLAWRSQAATA